METRVITVADNVWFIEAENLIVAQPIEHDHAGMFEPEVVNAAKAAGLPTIGWRKSEYTDSFVLVRG